jgi:hypothetical protein
MDETYVYGPDIKSLCWSSDSVNGLLAAVSQVQRFIYLLTIACNP